MGYPSVNFRIYALVESNPKYTPYWAIVELSSHYELLSYLAFNYRYGQPHFAYNVMAIQDDNYV